jgi:hypothetical protein
MSAEPSTESSAAAVAPTAVSPAISAAAPARGAVNGAPPPRNERELNAPSPLALSFLGVVFLTTFGSWVAAKVACNGREPPVRQPPELSLDILARQPKDAALELQQRAASGRFREAAELARGDAARELLEADARCQSDPRPCEALRANAEAVTTRAVLVGRGPLLAEARVESQVGEKTERYVLKLSAEGSRWYVTSRAPYSGELLEPLPVIQMVPVPGAIAAPAPSPSAPPPAPSPSAPPPAAPRALAKP